MGIAFIHLRCVIRELNYVYILIILVLFVIGEFLSGIYIVMKLCTIALQGVVKIFLVLSLIAFVLPTSLVFANDDPAAGLPADRRTTAPSRGN